MITDHHDGHGLNERIRIFKDEPGPGGASHHYRFAVDITGTKLALDSGCTGLAEEPAGFLQYQKGPRDEDGSTPGVTELAVLAVVVDRLRSFQAGPFSCRENAIALTKIEEAMHWMKARADARAKRGVLGKNER